MTDTKLKVLFDSLADRADYEVGYRGGHYGFRAEEVVDALFPTLGERAREKVLDLMPGKYGAYCNYLGGGLRGAVTVSNFASAMPAKYAGDLERFGALCVEKYLELEGHMNDEYDEDGEPNWDAIGSNRVRAAGVVAAY